ncbi:MAG: hypothetical protein HUU55_07275 [Myxococcales bacterium]|nr:hypothetical protein [Myxococcales bacterium]
MNKKSFLIWANLFGLAAFGFGEPPAWAVPGKMVYHGELTAPNGVPFNGTLGFSVGLYSTDGIAGGPGVAYWTEDLGNVDVVDGRVELVLGATNALGLLTVIGTYADTGLWLGVTVDGEPLLPRQFMVSVPYALVAGNAQKFGGLEPKDFLKQGQGGNVSWIDGPNQVKTAVAVGIGQDISAPEASLHIKNPGTASDYELFVEADETANIRFQSNASGAKHWSIFTDGTGLGIRDVTDGVNRLVIDANGVKMAGRAEATYFGSVLYTTGYQSGFDGVHSVELPIYGNGFLTLKITTGGGTGSTQILYFLAQDAVTTTLTPLTPPPPIGNIQKVTIQNQGQINVAKVLLVTVVGGFNGALTAVFVPLH